MCKQRTSLDKTYLEKQAHLYKKSSSIDRKHDLLYRMGTNADVLSSKEIIAISNNSSRLTKQQRQSVIDLIARELNIELDNWDDDEDLPPKLFYLMPDGVRPLYYSSDPEPSESSLDERSQVALQCDVVCVGWHSLNLEAEYVRVLVDAGISFDRAVEVAPLLDKYPRSPLEKEVVTQVWEQLCKLNPQ